MRACRRTSSPTTTPAAPRWERLLAPRWLRCWRSSNGGTAMWPATCARPASTPRPSRRSATGCGRTHEPDVPRKRQRALVAALPPAGAGMTDLEQKPTGGLAPMPAEWTYAPAPESRDVVSLRESYGLFIGGEWLEP